MTQLSQQIRELAEQYEPNGCALTDAQWINIRNKAARVLLKNAPTILAALELAERLEEPGCVERVKYALNHVGLKPQYCDKMAKAAISSIRDDKYGL